MMDIGEERGAIDSAEKEMIENVFDFNDLAAEDVMIHRTEIVSLWVEDTDKEIARTIEESGLSRFPVYDEDLDDVIGVLFSRDYFLNARKQDPVPLRELLRKAYFVPESVPAGNLFRDMQSKKIHLAIVVDEYGGTSGLITMEDLLEEIVGKMTNSTPRMSRRSFVWGRISGGWPARRIWMMWPRRWRWISRRTRRRDFGRTGVCPALGNP